MINIFWFRRDLRLQDNTGLYHALKEGIPVLPIFIFDKNILEKLPPNDKRVVFIHQQIILLDKELQALGSRLTVFYNDPIQTWKSLIDTYKINIVFTNHDYEPYAIKRDETVQGLLEENGAEMQTYKDQCIFEKNEILSGKGTFYTVFTPYSKKWKKTLTDEHLMDYTLKELFQNFISKEKIKTVSVPCLESLGFETISLDFPSKVSKVALIKKYSEQRDTPSISGTSRLGIHLRFGTISIRALVKQALKLNETFLNELIWRDFYMMILFQAPKVVEGAFKKDFQFIPWRDDEQSFELWCQGKTGYPFVDAGMRELNATGFMHNRARMITASFLVKHLLIDWRWGEAYFAEKLLDFDLASNNGGWQWAASTGCDAAPYFRIFNPTRQLERFDKDLIYVKKWIPEFNSLTYPNPIVDHKFARQRAIDTYKEAKEKS